MNMRKMMGRLRVNYMAQCPFYVSENGTTIRCEGVSENNNIELVFSGNADKYKDQYCTDDWENCLIARMLWSKYR